MSLVSSTFVVMYDMKLCIRMVTKIVLAFMNRDFAKMGEPHFISLVFYCFSIICLANVENSFTLIFI